MARRVFYSFHYSPDSSRASQVRNIGALEGNRPASDNDWESITSSGEAAITRWIDEQMTGRSCVVVLIGSQAAGRKWINYEIRKGWNDGRGLLGIYIHRLKNLQGLQSAKGANPFDGFTLGKDKRPLSRVVQAYDPPFTDSKLVYGYIRENLAAWFDEAVAIRQRN
jgi:hypothetical protein